MSPTDRLSDAVRALVAADGDYVRRQAAAAEQLSEAQRVRARAMRRVAALGLSHRRIAELTSLSHTRVNQILGVGEKPLPADAHLAPGLAGAPTTVASAVIRIMAGHDARSWSTAELRRELHSRQWRSEQLDEVLIALVTDGVVLSHDDGGYTIHAA